MEIMEFAPEVQQAEQPNQDRPPSSMEYGSELMQSTLANFSKHFGQLTLEIQPVPETVPASAEV